MKKLILALIMVASATISFAQSNQAFPQKTYWASDYGTWQVHGQTPNTYQFQPASLCAIPQPSGGTFNAFSTNAPVYLEDASPSNSELLTPAFVNINESLCQVALNAAHTHYSFNLMSGTAGLQEVLNVISSSIPYATQVILDRNWYTAVNSIPTQTASAVIASVKGNAAAILVDNTQAPSQYYTWNGTHYVAVSSGGSANFPSTPGVVWNTSSSTSVNASSSQIATVLNTSPSTLLVPGVLPLATSGTDGIVKPDNTTITVGAGGVISASPTTAPGGTDTEVQVNHAGTFYGNSGLTYNYGTNTLTASNFAAPSTGSFSWLTSGSQVAGISSPSPGVVCVSTTTAGNCTGVIGALEYAGQQIALAGTSSGSSIWSAGATAPNITYTLPQAIPPSSGTPFLSCVSSGTCSWVTGGGGGGANFPSTNGIVFNTSTSASRNATAGDIGGLINYLPGNANAYAGPLGTATSSTNYNSNNLGWSGSYWNGTTAVADIFACNDIVTGGTNPFTLLNCTHSGSSGGNEIQLNSQLVLQQPLTLISPGDSVLQMNDQATFFPTTHANNINNVFYADGFTSGTGNFSGIGAATIAYSSSVDAAGCQSVSYGGNYYLALATPNRTTTPGTNLNIWWPVPQSGATTNVDCAWYLAEAYKHNTHTNALVMIGAGTHYTNGLVDLVDGSSYDDENAVSLRGCGDKCSYVQYSGAAAIPMINRPTGGANFASMTVRDMTLDGNGLASAVIEVGSLGQSYFENFSAGHVAPGSDHVLEFGHFGGDAFQVFVNQVNIGIYPDNGSQNCGVFTANVVSGSITSYTVNNGGNCYNSTGYGGADLTVVMLQGYKGGTSNKPCTVMPTGMTATIVGAAVTAISAGTGGSGCSGTIDVQVYQTPNVNYGAIFNNSDSTVKDIISYSGSIAAFNTLGMGDGTAIHLHPSVTPNGVITLGGLHLVGTEIDDVGGFGIQIQNPYTQEGTPIVGTNAYIGGNRFLPGSHIYEFTFAPNVNDPVNISASGSLCSANPGGGVPTDWQEFVMPAGTINSPADYIAKALHGLSVIGNDTSCGQTMGDYDPGITLGSLTVNALAGNSLTINPSGTATSGANYNSGNTNSVASYWNGTSAANCAIGWANQLNSGTNPAGQYNLVTSGCVGAVGVNLGYNNFSTNGQIVGYGGFYTAAGTNNWIGGTLAYSLGTAIASASTIAPINGATHITGSATVNTITLPTSCLPSAPWVCMITLISDGGFITGTSGNISVALTTTAGNLYQFEYDNNTSKWYPTPTGSGGGSGTITSGTAWSPTFYAATGNTVQGTTPFTGLEYWPGSAAPQAATPSNLLSLVGYYTGAYSSGTTYKFNDIAADGSGNNYISLSAGNVGNALTNATYWHFLGGVSTTITGGNCTSTNQFVTSISTTGVPTCSGLGVALTSPTTITSTSLVTTGLALPSIPVSSTTRGHCSIIWEQSTATNTVQFGAGNSSTPTDLYTMSTLHSGASGGTSTDQYTTITSTTTTAISATGAPGATATGYKEEIDLTLVNSSTGADVVTIYALTGNASDAVVIEPGSSCEWLP